MLQGFIFGTLLYYKSKSRKAHKYLGLTVFFLSFYLLWVLKYDYGLQKQFPSLEFLPVLFLWGIGPAFYSFLRFSIGKPISSERMKWHFMPLGAEWVYFNSCTLVYWANDWDWRNLNQLEILWVDKLASVEHSIGLISIGIYLLKSFYLLFRPQVITSAKIRYIFYCFTLLWVIWVPYSIFDILYYDFQFPPSGFYIFYIFFSALTYCIGFVGFKLDYSPVGKKKIINTLENQMLSDKIKVAMQEEKYYLDPDLTLITFAKQLNIHPNKVSAVLNNEFKKSFRDFVNSYRINEFKSRLETQNIENSTLLGLAYDAGFNSKASFNRIFKKEVGMTPNTYLKQLQN